MKILEGVSAADLVKADVKAKLFRIFSELEKQPEQMRKLYPKLSADKTFLQARATGERVISLDLLAEVCINATLK